MSIRPSKRPSDITRARAKELRVNASQAEKLLWSALRGKNVAGIKFRRQHPIEPYIADFYCHAAKLVIEVDGESHDTRIEYDRQRTEFLASLDLQVVRISNDDVLNNLEGVVEFILQRIMELQNSLSISKRPSPNPSPEYQGGG